MSLLGIILPILTIDAQFYKIFRLILIFHYILLSPTLIIFKNLLCFTI